MNTLFFLSEICKCLNITKFNPPEEKVRFDSEGLKLAGVLHLPDRKAPGVVLCHGAGGHKLYHKWEADPLVEAGFAVLRFDFRGCGESEGKRGMIKPSDEIRDLKNAITYLQGIRGVDGEKVGVLGHSLGGAVAIACSSEDRRIKAAVAISAPSGLTEALPFDRDRILRLLSMDKVKRAYGEGLKMSLDDVPAGQRRLSRADLQAAEMLLHDPLVVREFFVESIEEMMTFRVADLVDRVSPTPILFIYGEEDLVTHLGQAHELYERAKEPKEIRIIKDAGHAIPVEEINPLMVGWFRKYLI